MTLATEPVFTTQTATGHVDGINVDGIIRSFSQYN